MNRLPARPIRFSEETYLEGPHGLPLLREHWVRNSDRTVQKYSLAFIDFSIYPGDHGRVLGYDNAHRIHERHFMGAVETFKFHSYEALFNRFIEEVQNLRRQYGKL